MKKKITLQGKLIIAAASLLCVLGTTVGVFALMNQGSTVTVDNFVGKTKKVVETWRAENEIEKDRVSYVYAYDEEKEQNIVIKQSIKAGETFSSDDTLKITLSKGADPEKEFELPDFTGKEEQEVKEWFEDNKFTKVTYAYEVSDSVEPGYFISMDHETGTKVKRSEEIKVTICTPLDSEEVTAPDFNSMSLSEIQTWASNNRINVSLVGRASDTVAENGVLNVSVSQGQRLKAGDTITVEYSTGPADSEDDRYNAQPKNDTVTQEQQQSAGNSNVSGGQPTTTPGNNQSSSDNTQTETPAEPETPAVQEFDVPDGLSNIILFAKGAESNDQKYSIIYKFLIGKGIPDDCIVQNPVTSGAEPDVIVSYNSDSRISINNKIYITVIDNDF